MDTATGFTGSMRRITYYAFARNPATDRIEQLFVTREGGRQVSQEWMGVEYRNTKAALAAMHILNCQEAQS